jgi:hypothetical protein
MVNDYIVYFRISKKNYKERIPKLLEKIANEDYSIEKYKEANFFSTLKKDGDEIHLDLEVRSGATNKIKDKIIEISLPDYFLHEDYYISKGFNERESKDRIKSNINSFILVAKIVYLTLEPDFGFGNLDVGLDLFIPHFKDCLVWLNFFGPELVKEIGREKLLSAPAYRIEEMSDGGIFLQSGSGKEGDLGDIKAIRKHLGFPKGVVD